MFQQGFTWQQENIGDIQTARVPGATHLLQMQNPSAVAEAIATFVVAHPLG